MEKPIIFISHILSDQETQWGIMELELYAIVYCVKQHTSLLTPYLMGKLFTVKTQEPRLSREFVKSKVGPLESATFGVQISHSAYPGREKRGGR